MGRSPTGDGYTPKMGESIFGLVSIVEGRNLETTV